MPLTLPTVDLVVVVPAEEKGFKEVFLGEHRWRAIRISYGKIKQIRYIAAYRIRPISAITHYAPIAKIEPYGEGDKYQLSFSAPPTEVGPIPVANAPAGMMQGPRYTTLVKLLNAKLVMDLF